MKTPYKAWKVVRCSDEELEDALNSLNDDGWNVRDFRGTQTGYVIIAFKWNDGEEAI